MRKENAAISGSSRGGSGEGRAEVTELEVGVCDRRGRVLGLNSGGDTRVSRARATSDTRGRGVRGRGVVGVEPEHVDGVVVPEGEDEDHTRLESVTHLCNTALGREVVRVTEEGLLGSAEVVRDGVVLGEGVVGRE